MGGPQETRAWSPAEREAGLGRNVDLFNALRRIAYRQVLQFKAEGKSRIEFYGEVFATAMHMNQSMGE